MTAAFTVLIILFANDSAMGITYTTPEACDVALQSEPQAQAARFGTSVIEAYCEGGQP